MSRQEIDTTDRLKPAGPSSRPTKTVRIAELDDEENQNTKNFGSQISDLSSSRRTAATSRSERTTTTTRTRASSFQLSSFQCAPSTEALTRFAWSLISIQFLVSVGGVAVSASTGIGAIGGVVSGIIGLFFVQLAWVVSIPQQCSQWPFVVGLIILPFAKSCGFLVLKDGPDWNEFSKRIAILTTMWSCPMYFVARTTGEVMRKDCGDVGGISNTLSDAADTGLQIREKVMVCAANYLIIFPPILFYTVNAVGALIEAGDYKNGFDDCQQQQRNDFECETKTQFYFDFMRLAFSNIFQGLVLVFAIITLTTLRCSRFDLGELVRFRLSFFEIMTFFILVCFFIIAVYCGSPLYDPTNTTAERISYWSIFVLPLLLMISLGKMSYDVLQENCKMRHTREIAYANTGEEGDTIQHGLVLPRESIFAATSSSPQWLSRLDLVEEDDLSDRIDSLETLVKDMRKELDAKKME